MPKTYDSLFSRSILFLRNLQLMAINELRHNNLKVYNDEGYGGQEIQLFPAYRFLLEYHNGNYDIAEKIFQIGISNHTLNTSMYQNPKVE